MPTRVLITGVTGFVGSHLAEYCLDKGCLVFGTGRRRSPLTNIQALLPNKRFKLMEMELDDSLSISSALKTARPDLIFHLAAQSYVPASFESPHYTLKTNILGTLTLLESLRQWSRGGSTRLQIAGSSEEYGLVYEHECPIVETQALRPLSPYGVSKVACDLLAAQYARSYGMQVVRTRAFNHEGARRGREFVTSNFAYQAVLVAAGKKSELKVGNLDAVRDFSHVKDIIHGYWLALEKGESGEVYNICNGKATKISQVIDILSGILGRELPFSLDRARLRPSDVPYLVGDCAKFRKQTGWEPHLTFDDAMKDLVAYWREHLGLS
ncbi:MAG: GDP-mannose 4,6-dehydratase [Chloroflexi bacterium]|nr:GDP-mannose 4,6-dehydratase [Chloroflexota bacterium]